MPAKKPDVVANFFSKIVKDDETGCWLWTGGKKPDGYGVFCVNRRPLYAHRWSYEYHKGPLPEGIVLDHLCRVKHCVNPDHLDPVTQKINAMRAAMKTHCKHGHAYDEQNTYIRSDGGRDCKQCQYDRRQYSKVYRPADKKPRTHCAHGHPLTPENTYVYGNNRQCRTCQIERGTINKQKNRQDITGGAKSKDTHCPQGHLYKFAASGKRRCSACHSEYLKTKRIYKPRQTKKHYSRKEWEELKAQYHYTCLRCQRNDVKLTADHVIPKRNGGADTIDNMQPLCMNCNIWNRNKMIDFRPKTLDKFTTS